MGEAARRKKLAPNYGKFDPLKSKVLKNAIKLIDKNLSQIEKSGKTPGTLLILFTNKDRGCNEQELEMLEKEIPKLYEGKNFTLCVLPQKYASLPAEEALDYFVPVIVGEED